MNATVKRIIEILFQDTEMNEETQALKDELMMNCQERYEDQRAQGHSEDEAIGVVVESLRGMEEVIASYPRKAVSQTGQDATTQRFPAEQVQRISSATLHSDVKIVRGAGREVVVRRPENSRLTAQLNGGILTLQEENDAEDGRTWRWGGISILFFGTEGSVTVEVPAACCPEIDIRGMRGDLTLRDVAAGRIRMETSYGDIRVETAFSCPEIDLHTTSGDVELTADAAHVTVQSMSGDVTYRGSCPQLSVQSISGDVDAAGTMADVFMKSVSGDLKIEQREPGLKCVRARSTSGDVSLRLPQDTRSVHAAVQSVSGDVHSAFPDAGDQSEVQAHIRTVSGDVRIKALRSR